MINHPGDFPDTGLRPVKVDKHGPAYRREDVDLTCLRMINANDWFYKGAKAMTQDAQKATDLVNSVTEEFSRSLESMQKVRARFVDESKQASGAVRDSAEKLAQGLLRVEKAANFARLQQYVDLLERAAAAMSTLAALEKDGKLDKIAGALR